ncbi:hypothetical protein [Lewinella sp. JB7]|uniref:hypothetical protein n=1 Tax=Lewinella sp. JB7 TaxID=2962887 RepID=UPI0020C9B58F|nr:hypothetical protein [Lewinella sp. JB7]MCP9236990.1 hypothetical protein [Lewinella sp. JB7]
MKRFLRSLLRFGKFLFKLSLVCCVAWTALTFYGLHLLATDPEARAAHIRVLRQIEEEHDRASYGQGGIGTAFHDPLSVSGPEGKEFVRIGRARPQLQFRAEQLVYVRPARGRSHYVEIMVNGEPVETIYGSIAAVKRQLPTDSPDFFVARGLIVNLNYVDIVHCESIPPANKSYFKLRVDDGCGEAYEVRISPTAIPAFRKKWELFCAERGWI